MAALPQEWARFWHHLQTAHRERKRIVRLLIEDVTVQKADVMLAPIRCKGGAARSPSPCHLRSRSHGCPQLRPSR